LGVTFRVVVGFRDMHPAFRLALPWLASVLAVSAAPLAWQDAAFPYTNASRQKLTVPGRAARLIVPENPAQPGGSKVDLAVFMLPATTPNPGAPIVYLHGGPGGSSLEHLENPDFRALFDALRQQGDVILFDQRGCGKSLPTFLPIKAPRIQTATLATRQAFLDYIADISTTIRDRLVKEGHDPHAYTIVNSAEDIEALRRALGVEKINLFAHSYGAQLAQTFARAHPASVGRMVLAGSRGMDTSRKLPAEADEFLARIAALARTDATVGAKFPDLLATLDRVLAKVDRAPVAVEMEGSDGSFTLKVGGYALRFIIAKFYLNDPDNFKYLPKLLDELDTGRKPWCLIFNLGQIIRGGISFVWFTTDAASGVSASRGELIARQAGPARLRDSLNFPFPDINRVWGMADLGESFRAPVETAIPTLFVAGTLDGITPVEQTRGIMRGFSASHLLVVEHGGHNSMFRGDGVPAAIAGFYAGQTPPEKADVARVEFVALVNEKAK
jgi:pimeloyl-ACP methyl ester carboxylesterase